MELQSEPIYDGLTVRDRLGRDSDLVSQCYESLFDCAPVMMHSIDSSGRLIRVNRKWLETLGYETSEVLGKKSIDLLTQESREWALRDTLPLFWKTGSARSIGYEMVKKNGRVVDVLLDADAVADEHGDRVTLATIRENYDSVPWRQSAALLRVLPKISMLDRRLQGMIDGLDRGSVPEATGASTDIWLRNDNGISFRDALADSTALCREISDGLRTIHEAQNLAWHTFGNQFQELLLVESTLDLAAGDLKEIAEEWTSSTG